MPYLALGFYLAHLIPFGRAGPDFQVEFDPAAESIRRSQEVTALTLLTCYPFYFVGPVPSRLVIRAPELGSHGTIWVWKRI